MFFYVFYERNILQCHEGEIKKKTLPIFEEINENEQKILKKVLDKKIDNAQSKTCRK